MEPIEPTPIVLLSMHNDNAKQWYPNHRPIPRMPQESLLSTFQNLTNLTGDRTALVKVQ